ncbi:MAG: ribonuclease HII [bacterium]|nr:ribonuclease HII [bacterium]
MNKGTIIGVDEVGRGPLAGPLAVGALRIARKHQKLLKGVKDSKKLDAAARERWYKKLRALEKEGSIVCKVAFVSERIIDRHGIPRALMRAVGSCLRRLAAGREAVVLLDGALYAPPCYVRQRTIIRGDEKHLVIAAASIIAKVRRDRRMKALSKKYPLYLFESHKGYGTKAHYERLRRHGPSAIHRLSYLKKFAAARQ